MTGTALSTGNLAAGLALGACPVSLAVAAVVFGPGGVTLLQYRPKPPSPGHV